MAKGGSRLIHAGEKELPAGSGLCIKICGDRSSDPHKINHHLKSIFARHGIPETLVTDNGPQFSGMAFAAFAESYGFHHVTSSPKYPQSNGEAERAVKTVKGLLKKAADPYLALLAYRATPLQNGYSPAQLERRLRTTVPTLPALLTPALPDGEVVVLKEKEKKMRDAQRYNLRHRAQSLNRLTPGKEVWVTDQEWWWCSGATPGMCSRAEFSRTTKADSRTNIYSQNQVWESCGGGSGCGPDETGGQRRSFPNRSTERSQGEVCCVPESWIV
ncbi:hypothetical protein SKAU_G00274250 [Synaphobranchus kaupii]|uniref:Integrase catalytic domain-containing protein n=1 Tax=Synaphobranchus kaupii TaxID=118154 RepID=A0A9Q1F170_SYNKA|nr:hypothetical protein SKAU_G00274250 [Synaphobranchus kaupii]